LAVEYEEVLWLQDYQSLRFAKEVKKVKYNVQIVTYWSIGDSMLPL
jgi:hypothetical protein